MASMHVSPISRINLFFRLVFSLKEGSTAPSFKITVAVDHALTISLNQRGNIKRAEFLSWKLSTKIANDKAALHFITKLNSAI